MPDSMSASKRGPRPRVRHGIRREHDGQACQQQDRTNTLNGHHSERHFVSSSWPPPPTPAPGRLVTRAAPIWEAALAHSVAMTTGR